MTLNSSFQQFLNTFPSSVHEHLQTMPQTGGMLAAEHCLAVMETLKISVHDLMLKLFPLAKLYSAAEVSNFPVGAVAKARPSDNSSDFALFLGANIEFQGQPPTHTIHAEQAAVTNAWLQGARQIEAIAVTTAPCGFCRQYLHELEGRLQLTVILAKPGRGEAQTFKLSDLLPEAFGPHELGSQSGLMAIPARQPNLSMKSSSEDMFVLKALEAVRKSYAPYSHNLAGCAIQVNDGRIYTGRYAENAAFNPSLSPLQTAIIHMNMGNFESANKITRAVLVEKPTSISQRAVCELLLKSVAPDVTLEYFEAR